MAVRPRAGSTASWTSPQWEFDVPGWLPIVPQSKRQTQAAALPAHLVCPAEAESATLLTALLLANPTNSLKPKADASMPMPESLPETSQYLLTPVIFRSFLKLILEIVKSQE